MKKYVCLLTVLCMFSLSGCSNGINVPVQIQTSSKADSTVAMTESTPQDLTEINKSFEAFVDTIDFSVLDNIELMEGYTIGDIKTYDEEFYSELYTLVKDFDYVITKSSQSINNTVYNVSITTLPFSLAWKNTLAAETEEEPLTFEQLIPIFKEQINTMKTSDRRFNSVIGFKVEQDTLNFDKDLLLSAVTGGLYTYN